MATAAAAASSSSSVDADPSSTSASPRAARTVRQPWSHVVRGESETSAAAALPPPSSPPPQPQAATIPSPDPSDRSPRKSPPEDVAPSSSEAARGKKPAWKRPINGEIEAGAAVMGGAASWPALSESAKSASGTRSSSSDASKPLSDGPLAVPPEPAISTASPKPNSNPSLTPKPNLNPSSTPNHVASERHQSMNQGGGSGNGALAVREAALPSPPPTSAPLPQVNLAIQTPQAPPELSTQDQAASSLDHGSWGLGLGSQTYNGGDHHRSYGGNRRWNNGGGSGSHNSNYGNRRDQERGGYDGYRRNTGGRDFNMQQRGARPFFRPPHVVNPYLRPLPQVRPFGNPMMYPDMSSPVIYVATQPPPGVPFVPHPVVPPAMYIPAIDPQRAALLKQIDYYFSSDNLCKDIYLRQNMDDQGWVPVSVIAQFNRVRQLTNSTEYILDTVRLSTEVEVQGEKIRKRNDWMNWILPSGQSTGTLNSDNLSARLRTVDLEGNSLRGNTGVPNYSEVVLSRSASGNLRNQLQMAVNRNDANRRATGLADSHPTNSGRSLGRSDTF
ncbi:la-related protein 1C-like isoform X1 [Musa acuminata AAA Group]|uniref:la-related protein 1C-like isoform X1 n=1 Tax=Musa acuminata AAA Group TaxID=214697 RepID=UPI0031D194E8